MRSKELFVELWDRIVLRHRSGEGYQNISAALKVPKNTVASITLKWKTFGTTKMAKLSNRGRRARLWKSLSGPARAQPWTRSYMSGDSCAVTLHIQPDRAWEDLQRKMGETPLIQVCQDCSVIPKKPQACYSCQRCFNKVLSKGSEYLCKCDISGCLKKKHLQKCPKKQFLICHYGVLCVDWWGKARL